MNTKYKQLQFFCLSILLTIASSVYANTLDKISYTALPGDQLQIRLSMSETPELPGSFTIDNPPRIAFDLANTQVNLKEKTTNIGISNARSITAVKAGNRTRVVLNLNKMVNYNAQLDGNDIIISLNTTGSQPETSTAATGVDKVTQNIQNIDFRRGEQGEGRIIITLADPNTPVDMRKRGKDIVVTVKDSSIPESLERRLDVLDFATLVKTVDSFNHGNDVRLIISATKDFDHIAYQTNDTFTIDVKPIVKLKTQKSLRKKKEYKGERLSLNFQNIDIRAVLQLIADFTGLNLVTSDSVSGNLTLRLKNVPWDQALDIVLKSKGLGMEKQGNVISVAPLEEIAARNKVVNAVQEVAPLVRESIQINYAKAEDLAKLIAGQKGSSLLSTRGSISIDERTNKLLVQDTVANIDSIAALVEELDVAVKQVLIESRVVLAGNTFSKELGVRFGVTRDYISSENSQRRTSSGNLNNIHSLYESNPFAPDFDDVTLFTPDRYNVNLPVVAPMGSIGLAVAKLPYGTLLELELSAAQEEGKSETISSPKVVTANQKEAYIEAGTEVPYQEASSSGATTVAFKKAVLSLKVTPQITPDSRVIMDLEVTKDAPDFGNVVLGVPPILTQRVETQVLVDNGETIVLGGVYERTKSDKLNRVPFFGDIPIIGVLFRSSIKTDEKQELLIFVTPKIIKDKTKI